MLSGVLQEKLERIFPCFLTKIRKYGDVAPDNGLQRRSEISDDAARTHDDAANNPKISDNAYPGNSTPEVTIPASTLSIVLLLKE
jgi:hypothetical protein